MRLRNLNKKQVGAELRQAQVKLEAVDVDDVKVEVGVQLLVRLGGWSDKMKVISYPTLVSFEVTTCPDEWVGGWWVK